MTNIQPSRKERRGLSLAAFVLSLVAVVSTVIAEWHAFAISLGVLAFLVSIFVLVNTGKGAKSRPLCFFAICASIVAMAIATYSLYNIYYHKDVPPPVPVELQDTTTQPPDESLDLLKKAMDSSGSNEKH